MVVMTILFVVLHIVSVGVMLAALWRLYHYISRYKFSESKYTLLFGFLHLRWLASGYFLAAVLWIGFSYLIFV